jgi:2-methylcitrate dehydratase PrpD
VRSQARRPSHLAAFANGTAIHAEDYDDTRLAAAKDRVYGLLMHPTALLLPVVLAVAEQDGRWIRRPGRECGLPQTAESIAQERMGDAGYNIRPD